MPSALVLLALFVFHGAAVANAEENNTNETEVIVWSPDKVKTTTFSFKVKLQSVSDFDVDELKQGLAASMGVDVSDVDVDGVNFEITAGFSLASAVNQSAVAAAKAALVGATNIPAQAITVTVSSRRLRGEAAEEPAHRRLGNHEGNKLAVSINIPVTAAESVVKAGQAMGVVGTPAAAAGLAGALQVDQSTITADPVELAVSATTTVRTTGVSPVTPPTSAKLLEALQGVAPAKTFEVIHVGEATFAETDKVTEAPTVAPTAAPTAVAPTAAPTTALTSEVLEESKAIGVSAGFVPLLCGTVLAAAAQALF